MPEERFPVVSSFRFVSSMATADSEVLSPSLLLLLLLRGSVSSSVPKNNAGVWASLWLAATNWLMAVLGVTSASMALNLASAAIFFASVPVRLESAEVMFTVLEMSMRAVMLLLFLVVFVLELAGKKFKLRTFLQARLVGADDLGFLTRDNIG